MHVNISNKFFINTAVILWVIFAIIICIIVSQQGTTHTVTPNYFSGANLWIHGKDLYDGSGRGFIYLPQAAVLFMPLTFLAKFSFVGAEIVWRLISLVLLAIAVWNFINLVDRKIIARTFFIVTVATLPLIFSSMRNGQFNTILEAMMLLTVYSVAKERWLQAVFYVVLGFALKPTMIVLLLLLWSLYRSLWWRLPVGLLVVFVLPFFTQLWGYVISQYLLSIDMLKAASMVGSNHIDWSQIFALLAQMKLILPQIVQDVIRIIVAMFVLYCGILAKKKLDKYYAVIFLYTFAVGYLMLFNPRTECNDYGIIAPAIGLFISLFFWCNCKKQACLLVVTLGGLLMSGYLTFGNREFWSAPFFTIIFMIIVIRQIFMQMSNLQIGINTLSDAKFAPSSAKEI